MTVEIYNRLAMRRQSAFDQFGAILSERFRDKVERTCEGHIADTFENECAGFGLKTPGP